MTILNPYWVDKKVLCYSETPERVFSRSEMLFLELLKTSDFLSHVIFQGIIYFLSWRKNTSNTFGRMENFSEWSAVICFGASYLQETVGGGKRAIAVTWDLISLLPRGMWGCIKIARNQQFLVRGSSRDGKKRIWENTSDSLAGMCPSLSTVFPKAPWHLILLRCSLSSACICLE